MEEQIYRQPRRSGKKWILIIAAVFVLLLSAVAFVLTANRLSLSVELDGEPEMMLEYGGHFQDPGAQLRVRGSLLWKDGMSPEDVSVGIQGKVDDEKTGKYILTYAADYRGMHAEAQRIVRVVDTVCPEIILAPDTGGTLLPGTPYQEAGYRAIDNYDGDITDRVVRSEENGKIIYAVTDSSGNPGYAEREVPYYDPIPPEIVLEGDADMAIVDGSLHYDLQIEAKPLFREGFFLVVPKTVALTEPVEATTLHVQDEILIYGQPEILQWHDYWFGVDARPLLYADTPQLAETLPACGKRWSIIPAGATEPYLRMFSNVQVLHLAHPPAERTFYLVTPKGRALSAAAETLLDDLRTQIQHVEGITWY